MVYVTQFIYYNIIILCSMNNIHIKMFYQYNVLRTKYIDTVNERHLAICCFYSLNFRLQKSTHTGSRIVLCEKYVSNPIKHLINRPIRQLCTLFCAFLQLIQWGVGDAECTVLNFPIQLSTLSGSTFACFVFSALFLTLRFQLNFTFINLIIVPAF